LEAKVSVTARKIYLCGNCLGSFGDAKTKKILLFIVESPQEAKKVQLYFCCRLFCIGSLPVYVLLLQVSSLKKLITILVKQKWL
jgi:hypothetical protein